jgi:hypothetical protein
MAKDTATNLSEMAERSVEQAAQVAASGMNWMRGLTEENLNRSRVALEGYIETTRVAMDSINRHASELGQRSIATAEESLSNTFDFTDRLMRAKEPKEFAQLQSEFISRQTQCLADQAKERTGSGQRCGPENWGDAEALRGRLSLRRVRPTKKCARPKARAAIAKGYRGDGPSADGIV